MLRGALLVQLRLGALARDFLLGDPRLLLGGLGARAAGARLLLVRADRLLTALLELDAPALGCRARSTHTRHREREQRDDD